MTPLEQEKMVELDFRMQAIELQRNLALRDHAIAAAKLRITTDKLTAAHGRIAELEQQVSELPKPKEA